MDSDGIGGATVDASGNWTFVTTGMPTPPYDWTFQVTCQGLPGYRYDDGHLTVQ